MTENRHVPAPRKHSSQAKGNDEGTTPAFTSLCQLYLAGTRMSSPSICQTHGRDEQGMFLKGKPGGVSSFLPHLAAFPRYPNSHSAVVAWGLPSMVLTSLCLLLCPLALHPALLQ